MRGYVALAGLFCLIGTSVGFLVNGPAHASCKATWTFGKSCDTILSSLLSQVQAWSGPDNCRSGPTNEKCLYVLKSNSGGVLKLTHETPLKHYIDDITFTLTDGDMTPSGGQCTVKGMSRAETWYAVLDYGTNYCNMYNLLEGSQLTQLAGYTETTSDAICTQHSSANCTRY
ncbi:uncharacterized protein LOC117343961 [Pecten maximus]|uniref:uncharacterized protein LOC117343961 n=1 Tax=Pecten maximus TaxID=6579 RepID=UPI001458EC2A|nr:uncharacterized protein LOC117343961 [Pecten maximus]